MRTFSHDNQEKQEYYRQLALVYKRALPPVYSEDMDKEELESLEDTDTEKKLKKVNLGFSTAMSKPVFKSTSGFKEELGHGPNTVEMMERYKRTYELEKLRYNEERNKYFY